MFFASTEMNMSRADGGVSRQRKIHAADSRRVDLVTALENNNELNRNNSVLPSTCGSTPAGSSNLPIIYHSQE